jgi:integrase
MFNTAVADEVIARSPCRVQGAADEASEERPVATVAEIEAAVGACLGRYRAAILLAAWCQLRRGEILGLQRQDIDELHAKIEVVRAWLQVESGPAEVGPTKTKAGPTHRQRPPERDARSAGPHEALHRPTGRSVALPWRSGKGSIAADARPRVG